MTKLGHVAGLGMALVLGYVARGAAGCSSAAADSGSGGAAACECTAKAPEVAIEDCVAGSVPQTGQAVHAYPGKKATDLIGLNVALVSDNGTANPVNPTSVLFSAGKATVNCDPNLAVRVMFSLPR